MPAIERRTARLLLRQWRDADYAPFAALNDDPRVMEHFPAHLTRAESDAVADRLRGLIDERGWGLWAVEELASGDFIGFVGLQVPRFEAPFVPCIEVGWRLAAAYWGKGYATEAARAALAVGFDVAGADEILSYTALGNVRSRAVMERLGMVEDPASAFEHPMVPEGSPLRAHCLYRLSRAAFEATRQVR